MNVCKVFNVDLLLFVIKPVELISKQFTVVECSVMSVTKGAYFSAFFTVSLVYVGCKWDRELENVELFLHRVNDNDIRFEVGQAKFRWDGSPSCGFPAW